MPTCFITLLLNEVVFFFISFQELAFHELSERLPTFPPTYKFVVGTSNYDPKRRPAWCDRILTRVNSNNYENVNLSLQQNEYRSHPEDMYRNCSDHLPVSGSFNVLVFGRDLARARHIDDYASLVRFRLERNNFLNKNRPWWLSGLSRHVSNSSRDRGLGPRFESPLGITILIAQK